MNILLSSAYNASIQYYTKFLLNKLVVIDKGETYIKQSYRNRSVIACTDGTMALSIPVVFSTKEQTKMKDIRISDHGNWQHIHWNAIISAYNSTPFFEYYRDDYKEFYTKKYDYLVDFNDELLRLTLSHLNIDAPQIEYASNYIDSSDPNYTDLRETIHPKRSFESDEHFTVRNYYQVFQEKNGFLPNLSILDLLFNMGNESLLVLHNSISHKLE